MSLIIKEEDLIFIGKEIRENGDRSAQFESTGSCFLLNSADNMEYLILKYTLESLGYKCSCVGRKKERDLGIAITNSNVSITRYVNTTYPFSKFLDRFQ